MVDATVKNEFGHGSRGLPFGLVATYTSMVAPSARPSQMKIMRGSSIIAQDTFVSLCVAPSCQQGQSDQGATIYSQAVSVMPGVGDGAMDSVTLASDPGAQ